MREEPVTGPDVWATLRRNRRALPIAFQHTHEFAASTARRHALGDAA